VDNEVRRLVTLRELAAHLGARLAPSLEGDALTILVEPARVTVPGRDGAAGIVQGEHALGRIEFSGRDGAKAEG
jgi:hypothetical protein